MLFSSMESIWQKVNNKIGSSSLPTLVGGANGGSEVVKMCKDYFKGILNCKWVCRVCRAQHRLQGELSGSWNAHVFFCPLDITSSKAALEQNFRAWLYFCRALAVCRWISAFFLSELFNMCIVHRYIPNSCLNTTIVPICKNKNGSMSDTSNYRPVAVATVSQVSKLLEHFILSSISPFVGSTENQFGFKAGHNTDQCTFLCKLSSVLQKMCWQSSSQQQGRYTWAESQPKQQNPALLFRAHIP